MYTDELNHYREHFLIPQHNGADVRYFTGNSLGLQPKKVREYILRELDHWAEHGVEGHFRGERPWKDYHHQFKPLLAKIVGAKPVEVTCMNTLTVNLHLLMVSFYRPTRSRYKIIMEGGAFPSDQYAMETQALFHGLVPKEAIIELRPRQGEHTLRTEDIVATIQEHGDSTALVMMGGVNYYTGQFFDIKAITEAAHKAGAIAGFDLAHAAGNVPLHLHDWNVDFACWCSYKYMNSGPGGPSGIFVHERHANNAALPRFAGWWGHDEQERFLMKPGFKPMAGADGWQLSNAQVLAMAAHLASLEIFDEVGMERLRAKSLKLTGYLLSLLDEFEQKYGQKFTVLTPRNEVDRGCQVSILTGEDGRQLFDFLSDHGVITDWREPNVIRLAPVPLYNTFEDVKVFMDLVEQFYKKG